MTIVDAEEMEFTREQIHAIETRAGDLFLDAAAGSGKTSVLVERFVQAVLEDGIDVAAILTITFTDKAAAQMRDRIRQRFHELGARDAARATEGAFISTIHGFCVRLLRAHALQVGLDPSFRVLDELEAGRLADAAFEHALIELADQEPRAAQLIAGYGAWDLRTSIESLYSELRSRGELHPRLPLLEAQPEVDLIAARRVVLQCAARLRVELGALEDPSARVIEALERLERVDSVLQAAEPWPGELERLRLPAGNGAALATSACVIYSEALTRLRSASEHLWATPILEQFNRLLESFGERYEYNKRARSGLDFEDLELLSRELLRADAQVRDRYRERFERVMVDEFQDTNSIQLELVDLLSRENVFTVGDAQQSIYGFRHADVELFNRRGEELAGRGSRATLRTNFRSRPEILEVVDRVFAEQFGAQFIGLVAGREEAPREEPRVELLVADKAAEWSPEGPWAPWRVAEARALARRIEELLRGGASARDVVVLLRATTDMRAYERALEECTIPTYTVGGRGYWSHPQVVDMVAYLRALANPRDEEALYSVLGSPLVGISLDALVLLAAASRESGRDPWWVLRQPEDRLDPLSADDRERLVCAADWIALERELARRKGVEELLDRALEQTGYDLAMLAMPGGERRLANVRKLMRLGREHVAEHGPDLHGFVELVRQRARSWRPDPDASEAPIESEALDAVRLMTIHRAKGLEFEIVCVADLGRSGRSSADVVRVGRDGQVGLRLARPGSGGRVPALAFDELGDEQRVRGAAEERRLFYVAMTRARERLILSGAAKVEAWAGAAGGAPIGWLGPALVGDVSAGEGVSEGVRYRVVREVEAPSATAAGVHVEERIRARAAADRPRPRVRVNSLSYSAIASYKRCAYRFYVERLLGLPPVESRGAVEPARAGGGGAALSATERGTVVHALLERLDFRRPVMPTSSAIIAASPRPPSASELDAITGLIERFAATQLCARLGRAMWARREQRFGFLFRGAVIAGMLDVIAAEPRDRRLIVDYKTDRLDGSELTALVTRDYGAQQLIYALAALRAGGSEVEVAHVFLEAPDQPVIATFTRAQTPVLEQALAELTAGLLDTGSFPVSDIPHRDLCHGCPAEGGLCRWPLEMTRRSSPEQLF
jgi:ATP-dependent helicase/nuclease subunit A